MQSFKSSFVILPGSSLLNSTASLPGAKPVLHKYDDIFKKFGSTIWLLSCLDFAGSKDLNLTFQISVIHCMYLYILL